MWLGCAIKGRMRFVYVGCGCTMHALSLLQILVYWHYPTCMGCISIREIYVHDRYNDNYIIEGRSIEAFYWFLTPDWLSPSFICSVLTTTTTTLALKLCNRWYSNASIFFSRQNQSANDVHTQHLVGDVSKMICTVEYGK